VYNFVALLFSNMSGKIHVEEVSEDSIESVDSDFRAGVLGRPTYGTKALGSEKNEDDDNDENNYPISKHPSSFIDKSRRKHLVDAVTAAVAARKKDEKEDAKNTPNESDARKNSDATGKQVESWEVAYFNGAAILDEIPVANRDQTDQVVFRGRRGDGQSQAQLSQRRPGLDANRYATKKTIAQGMLDVALLTANASQLKYVLQLGDSHPFYELMISLIVISIILQVVAGILFLVIGGLNINDGSPNQRTADILNVVISGFGIRATDPGQIKN